MALRAGYKGFKKLIAPLILNRPGTIAIDQDALNAEINKTFYPRSEQAVLGAKNLLPVPYYNGTSYVNNGVTFTVDVDGIVDADGTAGTGGALFYFRPDANKLSYPYDVIVSGLTSQGSNTTFNFGGTGLGNVFDVAGKTISANTQFSFCIEIRGGYQCNHLKFKPLIRMASDPNSTYSPYAMTNKELTEKVQGIINAASNAADFAAFKTALGEIIPVTRSIQVTPETREEITEPEEEPATKTTKKSTKKVNTEKEGE